MENTRIELRSSLKVVAYWTHGLIGAVVLLVSIDYRYMLYVAYLFPVTIPAALIAIITGFVSIPTAILSLCLIGIFFEALDGPMVNAYVLSWFIIVGYQIVRILISKRG